MYERFLRSTSTEIFTLWDADLYALAGWQYVHGVSPDKINFEHPPLAKYLIGVSEVLFGNQNMLSAIFGAVTLVVAYLTSRRMFGPSLFGLVPVSMLSFDRMFLSYSATSTLDIYLTFFVALSSLLFIHAIKKPAFFVLVSISLGLAFSSKWTSLFLLPALVLYLLIRREWRSLKWFLASLPLAALTYCLSYLAFFTSGHTILDFISLQTAIYNFQQNRRYLINFPHLKILLYLLTGIEGPATFTSIDLAGTKLVKYGLGMTEYFNPFTWATSFSAALLALYYIRNKSGDSALLLPLWFFSFLFPMSVGQTYVWYLLPVLPCGFMSIAYVLKNMYDDAKSKALAGYSVLTYLLAQFVWSTMIYVPTFVEISG